MAWAPGALFAHALLPDEEVFSGSTADGQRLWTLGDVFEVFAWREGAEGYVELHVSPNGHQAHLRWTAADFQRVRAGEAVVEDFAGSARGRLKRLRSFGPEAAGGQRECGYRRLCCLAGGRWRRVSGWLCRSAGMTPGGAAAGRFCLRRRRTRFRRFTVWRSGGRFSWRDERARGGRGRRAAAGGWRSGNFF